MRRASVTPLGAAALGYSRRGLPVLPCTQHKSPRIPGGRNAASADPERVAGWWRQWPDAWIGVPTGPESGWCALDVDPRHGGEDGVRALVTRHGPLAPTARQRTRSGGRHYVFAYPATDRVASRAGALGPGLDTRGAGGYIIVAPSPGYAWEVEPWGRSALALAPAWMVEPEGRLRPAPAGVRRIASAGGSAYGRAALRAECERLACAPEGTRNHALNRAAFALGRLVGGGELLVEEVAGALAHVALGIGLGRREAESTIASGLAAGMREPRPAPRRPAVRTGRSPR